MRRLMLLPLILLSAAILANSLTSISLSGNGGIALLKGLTNSSENMTAANNTTVNLSSGMNSVSLLSGNNGTIVLNNLSKSPVNLSFGSTPRTPPPPPTYDPRAQQEYEILRANHVGY
ncbi:MAG: hypothetical protein ACE14P_01505 [Methanotrichaceae archaeon]